MARLERDHCSGAALLRGDLSNAARRCYGGLAAEHALDANASVSMLVVVALVGNAAGFPYRPTIGPIAVAATWSLGCGATVFVLALNAVWTGHCRG
ncbi:hypothetical protein AC630_38105 [Bradyrhizobium sp. AS23.2]|nr:hypothetical protein AC630_38105 [Bradyrhizobium sp. AS23.2]